MLKKDVINKVFQNLLKSATIWFFGLITTRIQHNYTTFEKQLNTEK